MGKKAGTGGLAGKRPETTLRAIFSEGRGLRVRVVRPHECRGIPFSPNNEARGPWPTGHMPRSGPCALRGRAEPAPPGGLARVKGLAGKTRRKRGGRFSRRGAVSAPANTGRTQAKLFHSHRMVADDAVANRGHAWVERWCHRGRAEPAPPRGGQTQRRWPHGGKPGDDAEGVFLGGARSPRPCCEAGRKPRHNIIIEVKGTPGGLMGRSPGESEVSLAGVRSPPLRGVCHPGQDGLAGRTPA